MGCINLSLGGGNLLTFLGLFAHYRYIKKKLILDTHPD